MDVENMCECPGISEGENPNPVASKGDQIGVDIAALSRNDSIVVHTANSHYRIRLTDPGNGRALLQGGRQLTEPVEAWILGSSLDGSVLRNGWICVGHHMDAWANDKYIRTSVVQSLRVERTQ